MSRIRLNNFPRQLNQKCKVAETSHGDVIRIDCKPYIVASGGREYDFMSTFGVVSCEKLCWDLLIYPEFLTDTLKYLLQKVIPGYSGNNILYINMNSEDECVLIYSYITIVGRLGGIDIKLERECKNDTLLNISKDILAREVFNEEAAYKSLQHKYSKI